jgi:hypothetical protein
MSNPTPQAGQIPAPKGLVSRFIGVIISPRATFESVVAHPKWLGMLALVTIGVAVMVGGFLSTKVGQDAWLDAAMSSGRAITDAQAQTMEKFVPYLGYVTTCLMLVVTPLTQLVVAGILFGVFNAAFGGNATFKQVFAVVVHTGPIALLAQLFTIPLNYARGTMTSATNLGVLLPMLSDKSFAGKLAGMFDVFILWQLLVLAMGLGVLYRRRTQPIATGIFVIYVIVAIIIAFVRRGAGA